MKESMIEPQNYDDIAESIFDKLHQGLHLWYQSLLYDDEFNYMEFQMEDNKCVVKGIRHENIFVFHVFENDQLIIDKQFIFDLTGYRQAFSFSDGEPASLTGGKIFRIVNN